ncbi:MAG: cyanophycinase [Pyrinomonadaceae bacterium]
MIIGKRSFYALAILALAVCASFGQQRLVVIGGGKRPPEAMKRFVEWSGGEKARLLIITWASGEPDASFKSLSEDFAPYKTANVMPSPIAPIDSDKRARFVALLKDATGIFFAGGDQNRIMDVLKNEELLKLLRDKYAGGTPFGGTSAGAAVMSDPMMTGDADLKILDGTKVGVRTGLGLLPNVMFDQHFLVRQRHNRLFGFVMKNPAYLGVGIDEDNAILISDNKVLEVAGTTWVMLIDARGKKGAMTVNFLKPKDRFDLKKRKRMAEMKSK